MPDRDWLGWTVPNSRARTCTVQERYDAALQRSNNVTALVEELWGANPANLSKPVFLARVEQQRSASPLTRTLLHSLVRFASFQCLWLASRRLAGGMEARASA